MSKKKHKTVRGPARQEKKKQFQSPEPKSDVISGRAIGIGAAIVLGIVILYLAFGNTRSQTVAAVASADLRVPVAEFSDGQAKFYKYSSPNGQEIKFFVVKSSDGIIRAAFDACDVCFKSRKGYRQQGDDMVCTNCGRHFPSVSVNVLQGGCNPAPLNRSIEANDLVIRMNDLQQGATYF